ncbi:MAG: exodeoxyribonuclease VII large subunit [Nitrospinae bacterium]|nr:exodeoxyribonuclease VII large subunit [Nitrospinota bacterium]
MNIDLLGSTKKFADQIYTISQLNSRVREHLEQEFSNILVEGEISSWKVYPSNHAYLVLKDSNSKINAVMFAGRRKSLDFTPEVGMRVLVKCSVTLFEREGRFQLTIFSLEPLGEGILDVKFRQLREKLELEGLFSKERKKKLPLRPKKIILVTSREGAALRDMLPILSMRIPFVELTIIHTLVQGEFAPRSIERALLVAEENNRMNSPADLIILSRGGGSHEDLSAFNDEIVIRAIDNCSIPILTAIGHEIDSSLSDLVSDDFSSTPTSAAEKVCRNWDIILERFMRFPSEMERYVKMILKNRKDEVAFYERMRILEEPTLYIQELQQKIDMLFENLLKETKYVLSVFRNRVFSILPRLRVVSPLSLHSSKVKTMEGYIERIEICIEKIFHAKNLEVKNLILRLESVSPISILARGYSLTYREKDHSLIRSIQQVENQELLRIKLSDGALDCRVEKINQKGETK